MDKEFGDISLKDIYNMVSLKITSFIIKHIKIKFSMVKGKRHTLLCCSKLKEAMSSFRELHSIPKNYRVSQCKEDRSPAKENLT